MRKVVKLLNNQIYANKTQVIAECLSKETPFKYIFDFVELTNVKEGMLYNSNITTDKKTLKVSKTYELIDDKF